MLRTGLCSLALGFTLVTSVLACDCVPPPSAKVALEKSAAVFVGKVTAIGEDGTKNAVTFEIEQPIKGVGMKPVVVHTSKSDATCGYSFKVGSSYLVYCYSAPRKGEEPSLSTNICTRTAPLADAKADLAELTEMKK